MCYRRPTTPLLLMIVFVFMKEFSKRLFIWLIKSSRLRTIFRGRQDDCYLRRKFIFVSIKRNVSNSPRLSYLHLVLFLITLFAYSLLYLFYFPFHDNAFTHLLQEYGIINELFVSTVFKRFRLTSPCVYIIKLQTQLMENPSCWNVII